MTDPFSHVRSQNHGRGRQATGWQLAMTREYAAFAPIEDRSHSVKSTLCGCCITAHKVKHYSGAMAPDLSGRQNTW